MDKQRAGILGREYRDRNAQGKGTEQDVAGAYNAVFESHKRTGRRTSWLWIRRMAEFLPSPGGGRRGGRRIESFNLPSCRPPIVAKTKVAPAARGSTGRRHRNERSSRRYTARNRLNRANGPEDRALGERCMGAQLPDVSGFRRIVQSPGSVSIFYDVGQGQGWQRIIP